MHLLVTGGTGFIGAHVVRELLAAGHEVTCFDLRGPTTVLAPVADRVEFVTGDVTDTVALARCLARVRPDRIVHLAAMLSRASERAPREAVAVNLQATLELLELAASHGVQRVIAASSVSAYGSVTDTDRLDEGHSQAPENVYGLTKYALERLGPLTAGRSGVEFATMQPAHGLGPDRSRGNVEDAFVIKAAVAGTPLRVPAIPHPIEIVAVQDTASAFREAITAPELSHDRYLVGSGERATLAEIVELVRAAVPEADLTLFDPETTGELARHPTIDTSRLRQEFGWVPRYSIEETVTEYVEWLRANPDGWTFDPDDAPWA